MYKVDKKVIEQRLLCLRKAFQESGSKLTPQRIEIFREVAQTGDHPNAETIYRRVRKRMPTVSLDTVYRTLWLLKDLGLIETLDSPNLRARFDANLKHHHHFVCTYCGLVRDFLNKEFDKIKLNRSLKDFGSVELAQVEVKGICHKCLSKKLNNTWEVKS